MTVSITDRSELLNLELRQLAERRLLFAFSRFDSRIKQVKLVVSDENGPRGGIDKVCRVSVSLHRAADVVVSGRDADMAKCISRVVGRAGRAVSRAIEKTQTFNKYRAVFTDSKLA